MGNTSAHPILYREIHHPDPKDTFISPHLNQQSIVVDPETGVRRSVFSKRHSARFDHVKNLRDLFENGLRTAGDKPCLGKRSSTTEPYKWITYKQADQYIRAFGSALRKHAGHNTDSDNIIGIYGPNSLEWVIAMHGSAAYGYVICPLYATLGNQAIQHILNQTEMNTLVCMSTREVKHIAANFSSSVKTIIAVCNPTELEELRSCFGSKFSIFSFDEFLDLGTKNLIPTCDVAPSDLFLISYTSGTAGLPKGVMIAHEQLLDALNAAAENTEGKVWRPETVHLSILPLAHIMEQMALNMNLMQGARVGFLTKGIESLLPDVQAVRPTTVILVPRIMVRIYDSYKKKVQSSMLSSSLFNLVAKKKLEEQKRGHLNHLSVVDWLCFKKLRQLMGGRLCFLVSGSAALSSEVLEFFRVAFNGLAIEGYGSTEMSGLGTLSLVGEYRTGHVGAVAYGLEFKLVDVPELNLVASRDNRGEICVRGLRCTRGYYKDPEKTAELIDKDGWLHSGDVGEWTPEGSLKIVDRVKSIFKLSQGEYVAPERVESVYKCCPLIEQILIDGSSQYPFTVAVVVPDFQELRAYLTTSQKSNGSGSGDYQKGGLDVEVDWTKLSDAELCESQEIRQLILNRMNSVAAEKNLIGFEKAKAIHLTSDHFTIENDLLTPTMKIARFKARQKYAQIIQSLYINNQ